MPEFIKAVGTVNWDLLIEEIKATYPNAVYQTYPRPEPQIAEIRVSDDALVEATLDTIIANHNPATLTTEQTKAIARTLMLSDAKNYLSNQLQAASPNVTNIYNTVRDYVGNNATLTQMVANEITLAQNAWGWTLNLATPTATDRIRYLICIQLVLATIA